MRENVGVSQQQVEVLFWTDSDQKVTASLRLPQRIKGRWLDLEPLLRNLLAVFLQIARSETGRQVAV